MMARAFLTYTILLTGFACAAPTKQQPAVAAQKVNNLPELIDEVNRDPDNFGTSLDDRARWKKYHESAIARLAVLAEADLNRGGTAEYGSAFNELLQAFRKEDRHFKQGEERLSLNELTRMTSARTLSLPVVMKLFWFTDSPDLQRLAHAAVAKSFCRDCSLGQESLVDFTCAHEVPENVAIMAVGRLDQQHSREVVSRCSHGSPFDRRCTEALGRIKGPEGLCRLFGGWPSTDPMLVRVLEKLRQYAESGNLPDPIDRACMVKILPEADAKAMIATESNMSALWNVVNDTRLRDPGEAHARRELVYIGELALSRLNEARQLTLDQLFDFLAHQSLRAAAMDILKARKPLPVDQCLARMLRSETSDEANAIITIMDARHMAWRSQPSVPGPTRRALAIMEESARFSRQFGNDPGTSALISLGYYSSKAENASSPTEASHYRAKAAEASEKIGKLSPAQNVRWGQLQSRSFALDAKVRQAIAAEPNEAWRRVLEWMLRRD